MGSAVQTFFFAESIEPLSAEGSCLRASHGGFYITLVLFFWYERSGCGSQFQERPDRCRGSGLDCGHFLAALPGDWVGDAACVYPAVHVMSLAESSRVSSMG